MNRKYTIWILVIGTLTVVQAQQYSPRTHFYENSLAYNPAIAGTELEIPIRLNFREQWVGMEGSPSTQTLSSHAYAGRDIGLGLVLYNDVAGPTRNTGFQGSVARHFAMDKEGKRWFSFGMSLQMFQFKFDVDRLQTDIPNDPAVQALARQNSRLSPDMSAGIYLNDENGFIGLSCSNMIQTKADIFKVGNNVNTVQRAYYLLAGYRFAASAQVVVEPVGLLKVTEAASWQADIMVRGIFNSNYWAGLSYRSGDAVSVLFGLRADMISFSYSYDYPVSKIGSFNTGTHEITAGVHIFNASSRYGTLQKPKGKDPLRNQPYKRFRRIP